MLEGLSQRQSKESWRVEAKLKDRRDAAAKQGSFESKPQQSNSPGNSRIKGEMYVLECIGRLALVCCGRGKS